MIEQSVLSTEDNFDDQHPNSKQKRMMVSLLRYHHY